MLCVGSFFCNGKQLKRNEFRRDAKAESSPTATIGWNIAMHFLPEEFGPQPVGNDSNRKRSSWVHGTERKKEGMIHDVSKAYNVQFDQKTIHTV